METIMLKKPVVAVLFFGCIAGGVGAQTCKTTDADNIAVVDAMRTLYAGATVDDMVKMHSVTAPNFYGFDGGHQYSSIDDLMIPVKADQDKGVKYVWNVTEPRVTIHCKEAWITYVNSGTVQQPGSAIANPAQWLESAVLEKLDGGWKIVFFHSTFVRPPQPAK
jgi:hypothetical protein